MWVLSRNSSTFNYFMHKKFKKELYQLAKKRDSSYPICSYADRHLFSEKLEIFSQKVIAESRNIDIDNRIVLKFDNFSNNNVFIGGYYKSGTSLLNSLFDYHPELVVLLPDSRILTKLYYKAQDLSREDFFNYLSHLYVKRLYNPNGHMPMNLLGEEENFNINDYAKFVAYLKYYINNSKTVKEILLSLSCAVFASNGQFERNDRPKYWVEKTPTNEHYIQNAKKLFPNSKFIFLIRNPYDNIASVRRWYINSGRKENADFIGHIKGLKKSYKAIIKAQEEQDCYIVKYEDLVTHTKEEMKKICDFLKIKYNDFSITPTILGEKDKPNMSDRKDENREKYGVVINTAINKYKNSLSKFQKNYITLKFRKEIKKFGYKKEKFWIF